MKNIKIHLPRPTKYQAKLLLDQSRNIACFAGRRSGKTEVGAMKLFIPALKKKNGLFWWIGLSWKSASMKRAWKILKSYTKQAWRGSRVKEEHFIKKVEKVLYLPTGSEIWLRTAENPESCAGEGVNGLIGDEFSLWSKNLWEEYVEGTLIDNNAQALLIGVPKGRNWAGIKYLEAKSGVNGWSSHHFTSFDNPHISHERLEQIRETTSDLMFRQEYLAEILDSTGSVFRGIVESATATPQKKAHPDHRYLMGIDWGKEHDYTVITVIDETLGEVVWIDRFNKIDYVIQVKRVLTAYQLFNPVECVVEINSMGSPIADSLEYEHKIRIERFKTTNSSKSDIIRKLSLDIERKNLKILKDQKLMTELQLFESKISSSGSTKYSAPLGSHDDMVMSLAFANSQYFPELRNKKTVQTQKRTRKRLRK